MFLDNNWALLQSIIFDDFTIIRFDKSDEVNPDGLSISSLFTLTLRGKSRMSALEVIVIF
jgi:hypothetical protein